MSFHEDTVRRVLLVLVLAITLTIVSLSQINTPRRPLPSQRKFTSPAVEEVIADISKRAKDSELGVLFSNCFPNTLDTTVLHYDLDAPDAFVVTGDIHAQWLRDSTNQVWPYVHLAGQDDRLKRLLCGLIKRQARDVLWDSYANAFNYNAEHAEHQSVHRIPPMTPHVFEGKWEVDSLASVLKLSARYFNVTGDASCFGDKWLAAMQLIVQTYRQQQKEQRIPLFSFQGVVYPPYLYTGMIRSAFRPSDDHTKLPYLVPSNAFAAVELRNGAALCRSLSALRTATNATALLEVAAAMELMSSQIRRGIHDYAVVYPKTGMAVNWTQVRAQTDFSSEEQYIKEHGLIYAYEVDGIPGSKAVLMDDANIPSLLSLPYLGFCSIHDTLCQQTRHWVLSPANYYYSQGKVAAGISSPHKGRMHVWPMSIIMQGLTSADDQEVLDCLQTVMVSAAGTGFIHESFWVDDPRCFTRPWFGWANSLFAELVLTTARERPHLIF